MSIKMMDKRQAIERSRMRLRERHMLAKKSKADVSNRLPVGQTETVKWPVLDLGFHPSISKDAWCLVVDGAVENQLELSWSEFMKFDQQSDVSDFHCVTTWSKLGMHWKGVALWDVIQKAKPHNDATAIMCYGYDDYCTNLTFSAAQAPGVLLVHEYNRKPLTRAHGGPCRVITPEQYAWKGTKWIRRIEVLLVDQPGYWETRGYSNTADPWTDDRYSE